MANRRMFSRDVVCTDSFMSMPATSQNLYYQYGMYADDDGFVSNPVAIKKLINASDDDFNILVLRGYIVPFENKIIVITHWRLNNRIRKDRYHPTVFQNEYKQLRINDNAYSLPDNSRE